MPSPYDAVMQGIYIPFMNAGRQSGDRQTVIATMLRRKFLELMMNRFEWHGLPDEVNKRWLEMSVNLYGCAVFFHDDDVDKYMVLRGNGSSALNLFGEPTKYIVYGPSGDQPHKELTIDKCVPIWPNFMRTPDWDLVMLYSDKLAQIDRSIEINAENARRGKVVNANENTRLSLSNIVDQINAGAPVVKIVEGMLLEDSIKVLDFGVDPSTIVNLSTLRGRIFNEALTMLGINSSNQDKKERLVAAEVSGNDDTVEMFRVTNLQARQIACDHINDMFGLDVSVEYATDMNTAELVDMSGDPEQQAIPAGGNNA